MECTGCQEEDQTPRKWVSLIKIFYGELFNLFFLGVQLHNICSPYSSWVGPVWFVLIFIFIILTFFLPWNLPRESQSSPYSWRQSYFIFDVVIIWSCAVVLQSWLCPNCTHNYNLYLEFCIFCGKKMRTGKIVNMTTLGLQKDISTLINRTNILFWAGRV